MNKRRFDHMNDPRNGGENDTLTESAERSRLAERPERRGGRRVSALLFVLCGCLVILGGGGVLAWQLTSHANAPAVSTGTRAIGSPSAKQSTGCTGAREPVDVIQQQTAQGLHLTVPQVQARVLFQASEVSETPGALALHPEIEEALFRVAQEALTNAARHGQASQVHVQLEQGTEQVCLHVSDNGKGFTVEQAVGSGHGLANMRDRVEAHNGTLYISSTEGKTVVTGCIALALETQPRNSKRKETHA
jgi:anti-sigma regulatory factor (Ser/Thr protein kinase)